MTSEYWDRIRRQRMEAKRKKEIMGNVQFEDDIDINEGEENEK
jgi:hypothetical protein